MKKEKKMKNEPEAAAAQEPKKKSGRSAARRRKRRAARIGLAVTLSVVILLLVGGAVAALIAGHRIAGSETTLNNVYIGDVYVGGMTREQVAQTLRDNGWDETHSGTLTVTLPAEISFDLDYYEAGISHTPEQMAEHAHAYGHGGDYMEALTAYIDGLSNTVDVGEPDFTINDDYIRRKSDDGAARFEARTAIGDYKLDEKKATMSFLKGGGQMTVDREALFTAVRDALLRRDSTLNCNFAKEAVLPPDFEALYKQLAVEPQDAYYDPETESIVPEVEGFTFDPAEALKIWQAAEPAEMVVIPVEYLHPALTAADLEGMLFRDLLGAKTTYYWGSSAARMNNISLVAEKLNGTVLRPGESFSFNDRVGERTEEGGFGYADAYENGLVVKQIGGGVCQTSSTLYNAVLAANLQVDDRTCHDFAVAYLDRGLDATVSYPRPDFQFTNNRDFPIEIRAVSNQGDRSITFEIWGTNVDGTYVIPTAGSWARYDTEFPQVQIGWAAISYRNLYDADGNLIERIQEAYSEYDLHPEDIKWPDPTPEPTKKPEATPEPTKAPEATPAPTAAPEATPAPTAAPEATPAPTAAPEATPAPTPAPTPEPEPTPAPTPAPTPEPEPDSSGDETGSTTEG